MDMSAQNPKIQVKPGFRPKLRYRKEGLGSLHLFNSIIKPGQIISVYPEDIPDQYKEILVCIDSPELQEWAKKENETAIIPEALYILVPKEVNGWFDVVNIISNKAINEKGLRRNEADNLLASLNLNV